MVKLKKVLAVTLGAALMVGSLAGCGNNSSKSADGGFDAAQDISVVSREEGSGTRGAFVELTGVRRRMQMAIRSTTQQQMPSHATAQRSYSQQ